MAAKLCLQNAAQLVGLRIGWSGYACYYTSCGQLAMLEHGNGKPCEVFEN